MATEVKEENLKRTLLLQKDVRKSKKRSQKQCRNSNNGSLVSCVCNCAIVEDTDEKDGKDAIFCEGSCNSWLHCKCASLSNSTFQH